MRQTLHRTRAADCVKSAFVLLFLFGLVACAGDDDANNSADHSRAQSDAGARDGGDPGSDGGDKETDEADAEDAGKDDGADDDDNMLANAGFEEGDSSGECPSGWECRTHPADIGTFSVDDQHSASGDHSAHWEADSDETSEDPIALFSQEHPSDEQHTYEISAWYRSEGLETAPRIQVLFFDSSDELIDTQYFGGEAGTRDWEQITGETGEAPAQTDYIRLNLSNGESTGEVWWDDASLVDTTPSDADDPPDDDDPDDDNDDDPINEPGERPDDAIALCDQGLSDGDSINTYIEDNFSDGATLEICRGTYQLDDLTLHGNDWTLIAPDGATLEISSRTSIVTSGTNYRVAGFIFDQSKSSSYLSMQPSGDDWVVDNVAWKGEHPGGGRLMAHAVESEGSTGLVDRMYMGDGQVEGSESGAVYAQYRRGYDGDMTFRRVYIAHFIDNAIYASSPGKYGHQGCTHVEDSFFWSNTISNARTGSPYQVCHVTGSVFLIDDTTQECGVGCSSPGARTSRAVWAWNGEVLVEDCDFTVTHSAGIRIATMEYDDRPDGSVTEVNNRVGDEASTDPPPGVPTSPEDIYDNPPGWAKPTP